VYNTSIWLKNTELGLTGPVFIWSNLVNAAFLGPLGLHLGPSGHTIQLNT